MGFAEFLAAGDRLVREKAGESVIYAPGVGSSVVSVTGVFDAAHQRLELGEAGINTQGPAVFLTLADLSSNPETDTGARLTIRGVVYAVSDPKPDGQGGILLHLRRTT